MPGIGRADLAALAHHLERPYRKRAAKRGVAHVVAHIEVILALFKNPGAAVAAHAGIVIACEIGQSAVKAELFFLAGQQRFGFFKRNQHPFRL